MQAREDPAAAGGSTSPAVAAQELTDKLSGMTPERRDAYLKSEEFELWVRQSQSRADAPKTVLDGLVDTGAMAPSDAQGNKNGYGHGETHARTSRGIPDGASYRSSLDGCVMRARSIVALLCSALLLSGCAFIPSQEEEPIVASGHSQFTKSGIEAMKASRQVRLDFTSLPLDMAALGLDEESDGAMVATDTDRRMKVAMTTPNGMVEMETDTIRVRGGGVESKVDSVDIFVNYSDAQDANPELKRAANELGIIALKDATTIGPEFKDGSGKETWNPGYGNATGTVFALSIRSNHTTGRMTFIYTVFLSEEYYTPQAQAQIAETGRF